MKILTRLASYLPKKLQPYAKAVVPSVVTVGTVAAEWGVTGAFNRDEIYTAGAGALSALITVLVPNLSPSVKAAVTDVADAVAEGTDAAKVDAPAPPAAS